MTRCVLIAATAAALALASCERRAGPEERTAEQPVVRAELRSWVVAGRARHLYLEIDAPPAHDHLDGRVEFTSVALRGDYAADADASGRARVGRMTLGDVLRPVLGNEPDDRVEAVYTLTLEQAECVTRDRVFSAPYVLLGTNSNAALRRAMESCGLGLPRRVLESGGAFGEFPGIDLDPGSEIPTGEWGVFGLSAGEPGGP